MRFKPCFRFILRFILGFIFGSDTAVPQKQIKAAVEPVAPAALR